MKLRDVGFYAVLVLVAVILFVIPVGISIQDQRQFTRECHSVAGHIDKDSDGDVECYIGDREIAELYENSPLNPK